MTDYIKQDRETAEYLMMASQETIATALAAARRDGAERQRAADVIFLYETEPDQPRLGLGDWLKREPIITDQEPTQ